MSLQLSLGRRGCTCFDRQRCSALAIACCHLTCCLCAARLPEIRPSLSLSLCTVLMNALHRPGTDFEAEPRSFSQSLRGGGGGTFPPTHSQTATPRGSPNAGAVGGSATPRSNAATPRPLALDESHADATVAAAAGPAATPSSLKGRAKASAASAARSKSAGRARSATRFAQAEESAHANARGGASPSPLRMTGAQTPNAHQRGFSFAGPKYKANLASHTPSTLFGAVQLLPAAASHPRTGSGDVAAAIASPHPASSAGTVAAPSGADGSVDRKSFLKLQRSVDSLTRQLQLMQRQASAHPASPASSLKKAQRSARTILDCPLFLFCCARGCSPAAFLHDYLLFLLCPTVLGVQRTPL